MELLENILFVAAIVFMILGIVSILMGIQFENEYKDSLEQMIDNNKGVTKSFTHLIKFGALAFIISAIVLIGFSIT